MSGHSWSMRSWAGRIVVAMVVAGSLAGCATVTETLSKRIQEGRFEEAIEKGETWLVKSAHKEKNRVLVPDVERLVCEAHLRRAQRTDRIEAYREFSARFSDRSRYGSFLDEALSAEAHAFYRDVAKPGADPMSHREFRRRYPGASDEPEVRRQEAQLAFEKEAKGRGKVACSRYRAQYEDWPEATPWLPQVRAEEVQSAVDEARADGSSSALLRFLGSYGGWPEAAGLLTDVRAGVVAAEFEKARRANEVDRYQAFVETYADWAEAREAIAEAKRLEMALAFAKVQGEGTWQAYRWYLETYPMAPNRAQAEQVARDLWGSEGPMGPDELRASVNLTDDRDPKRVDLYVQVQDGSGSMVGGVPGSGFEVYENGHRVDLLDFSGMDSARAIDMVFVLDTTASMNEEIGGVKTGIIRFAETLRMRNRDVRLGLVSFGDEIRGVFPRRGDLTGNPDEFQRWTATQKADGGGDGPENSLDALLAGLKLKFRKDAQVIFVLITDAPMQERNRVTRESVDSVARKLSDRRVTLFCVSPDGHQHRSLVNAVSGRWYLLNRTGDFGDMMAQISTITAKQYRLSYRSSVPPGEHRNVRVRTYADNAWQGMARTAWKDVSFLALDPRDPRIAFAASPSEGLFRSTDGGTSWSPARIDLETRDVQAVLAGKDEDAGLLLVTLTGRVYESSDKGASWTPSTEAPAGLLSVIQDPGTPDRLLATDGKSLFESKDFGSAWVTVGPLPEGSNATTLVPNPIDPRALWAVTPTGILATHDGGRTWAPGAIASPAPGVDPAKCRFYQDHRFRGLLFAVTPDGQVARSSDEGATWNLVYAVLPSDKRALARSIEFDPTTRHWILLTTTRDTMVSRDDGLTWNLLSRSGSAAAPAGDAIAIGADGRVLLGKRDSGALYTLNPVIDKEFVSGNVYFDSDSARVDAKLLPFLDELARMLQHRTDARLRVEGHTDDIGGEDYNLRLSVSRAESIRAYLASRGVPAERVAVEGLGKTQPLVANTSAANRGRNRRVEISILGEHRPIPAYRPAQAANGRR